MKNQKNSSPNLDLFSPIVDIFHELCVLAATALSEIIVLLYRKYTGGVADMEKIESKGLHFEKQTVAANALGVDVTKRRDLLLGEIDFSKHTFIVGASGFGKTNLISILQEHSLHSNKPIIFIDPKGDAEALMTFRKLCLQNNRACYVFSEHDPDSISLNPLLEGSESQVSDRLMGAFTWSEEFYKDACRRSLNKALVALKTQGQPFNLKNIYDYLCENETKENVGLITKLENILRSDFGPILSGDNKSFTISKIRKERACLYIGLSVQGYGETAVAVGKLFLGELLFNSYTALLQTGSETIAKTHPISVYFDEFGSVITPHFIELENKCRGAGIELTLAVQSASDINKIDPELTIQVIENTANLFVFKQRIDTSAAFFSKAIGTIITKKETFVTENGEEQSKGTIREVNELIVHPDIIKNLRVGQCILLRQGKKPLINLINVRNREKTVFKTRHSLPNNKPGAFDL